MDYTTCDIYASDEGWCVDNTVDFQSFIRNPEHQHIPAVQQFFHLLMCPTWDIHTEQQPNVTSYFSTLEHYEDSILSRMPWHAMGFLYIPKEYPRLRYYQRLSFNDIWLQKNHYLSYDDVYQHIHTIFTYEPSRVNTFFLQTAIALGYDAIPLAFITQLNDAFFYQLHNEYIYDSFYKVEHFARCYTKHPSYQQMWNNIKTQGISPQTLSEKLAFLYQCAHDNITTHLIAINLLDFFADLNQNSIEENDDDMLHDINILVSRCVAFCYEPPLSIEETSLHF